MVGFFYFFLLLGIVVLVSIWIFLFDEKEKPKSKPKPNELIDSIQLLKDNRKKLSKSDRIEKTYLSFLKAYENELDTFYDYDTGETRKLDFNNDGVVDNADVNLLFPDLQNYLK